MTEPKSRAMTASTDPESVRHFEQICREVVAGEHEQKGIGTLGERTLHVVLKNFYETDPNFREIRVGRFVADIRRGDSIVEIQTRAFRNLREKIPAFIAENSVKVVFPVAAKKFISWVDPESGEVIERRRSPKSGSIWDFLAELWELRPILPLDGLSFDVAYLELEEFRLLTGRSKRKMLFIIICTKNCYFAQIIFQCQLMIRHIIILCLRCLHFHISGIYITRKFM